MLIQKIANMLLECLLVCISALKLILCFSWLQNYVNINFDKPPGRVGVQKSPLLSNIRINKNKRVIFRLPFFCCFKLIQKIFPRNAKDKG